MNNMKDERKIVAINSGETKQKRKLVFSLSYKKSVFSFDSTIDDVIENVCQLLKKYEVYSISPEMVANFFSTFSNEIDETWNDFKRSWLGSFYLEWFYDGENGVYTFTLMRVANEFTMLTLCSLPDITLSRGITDAEIKTILDKCAKNVEEGFTHTFATYEEGIKDAIEWLLFDREKPEVITSEEDTTHAES